MKKIFLKIFFILIIAGSFSSGVYLGNNFGKSQCQICPPEEIDFSLFWEARKKLQEKFVDKGKTDNIQKLLYGAIDGMVKSLEDPYTVFFTPDETKKFLEEVKGTFEGVGLEVGIKKKQLQVIAPLENTPAQEAGLRPGDKILKINDVFTDDLTIEEAVGLIRGPKDTEVVLMIFRENWEKPKEIKIKRTIIKIPSLKWELKEKEIAYVKIYQFSEKAGFDFRVAAFEILKSPAKKIILDLRNNPGGYLDKVQELAGWFLEKGQVVAIEDFDNDKERKKYKASGFSSFVNYPIVVLINEGSASGAEILAGALRDNRGVKLIGEKTFGKGSVQELVDLKEKSSLKITIAKWLTPSGESITDKGLEPNIKVKMTEEDYEQDKDPQLEKALEIIRELR